MATRTGAEATSGHCPGGGQGDGTYQRTKVRAGRGDNKKDRLALKRKDDCPKSDGKSAGMVSNYRKGCVDSDF